ncbi:MAG: anaerobic ribonucleoside-triphosphate reductase activating protein [Erysipelothrix sp.]|nr:anaerobic ribonucleoside-triphosphate reductase activating protein [Erysipelothrix sp.]
MTIRLASLIHDSIVDGEGLRSVIFTQGCPHKCPGCHNPETIPFDKGKILYIDDVLDEVLKRDLKKVTFSGGEPFMQAESCYNIAKVLKEKGYNLWSYTGFTFERLIKLEDPYVHKFLSQLDILVDGPFILNQRNLSILFRGSENQRILDVQNSLKENKPIVSEKYKDPENLPLSKPEGIFI